MGYLLGVDLGTTFTAAAVANGVGPTMVGLGNRALQVPSVLFLGEDGFLVGESAERRGAAEPGRVVREFKRRLGDQIPVLVNGAPYSAEALMARLLAWVVARTGERMGGPPDGLVLTHPANWGAYKLDLLGQVVTLADVPAARWCPEPTAAAAQYATRARVAVGDKLAVYDLGGGTFDVCVLEQTASGFRLLGTPEGVEHLGGVDFDAALFAHVVRGLGARVPELDPGDVAATSALNRLRRDCVEAKEALSSDVDTTVPVNLPGLVTSVRVTRGELEGLVRPALEETVLAMRRALRAAEVRPEQLAGIVLVGGSSRIPLVGELLEAAFHVPAALDTHPKHDIALGALRALAPHPEPVRTTTPRPPPLDRSSPDRRAQDGSPPAAEPASASPSQPRRRRRVVVGAAAGAAVLVLVVVVAVANRPGRTEQGSGDPSTALSPAPSTPSPSTAPSAPAGLPVSAALPDSQLVVTMAGRGGTWDFYLGDVTRDAPVKRLTDTTAAEIGPVLSPTRQSVVYVRGATSSAAARTVRVAAADLSGDRELFPLPRPCVRAIRPAWSPTDPTLLALPCISADGAYSLRLIRLDGTVVRTIPEPPGNPRVDDPAFSPDGKTLAFLAEPNGPWDGGALYTVPVAGGEPKRLFDDPPMMAGQDADPAFSPDGRSLAFRRRLPVADKVEGQTDVFRADVDGTGLVQLTDTPGDEGDPSWSPDSTQIAFGSTEHTDAWPGADVGRVWVMNADGTGRRLLWTKGAPQVQVATSWTRR